MRLTCQTIEFMLRQLIRYRFRQLFAALRKSPLPRFPGLFIKDNGGKSAKKQKESRRAAYVFEKTHKSGGGEAGKERAKSKEKINQQKGQNDRRDAAARNEIREPEAPSGKSAGYPANFRNAMIKAGCLTGKPEASILTQKLR